MKIGDLTTINLVKWCGFHFTPYESDAKVGTKVINWMWYFGFLEVTRFRIVEKVFPLCGKCKWMNQGKNGCQCFNPKQTNKSLLGYVYYSFGCGLFEKGKQLSKEEMFALGYKSDFHSIIGRDGEEQGWVYYYK
jgi:hypothetical protein